MRIVTILLVIFLLPFNALAQATCALQGGQYGYCQCKMSDGSGIVDLSPYANSNGDPEYVLVCDFVYSQASSLNFACIRITTGSHGKITQAQQNMISVSICVFR